MLALSLALLAAEPAASGAVTVGASVRADEVSTVRPELAAEVELDDGPLRARVAPSVSAAGFQDLGSFVEWRSRSLSVRLEPLTPSLHLVTFDWANALAAQPLANAFAAPVLTTTFRVGALETFLSVRGTLALTPHVDVVAGATVALPNLTLAARVARIDKGALPFSTLGPSTILFAAGLVDWSTGLPTRAPLDFVISALDPRRFSAVSTVAPAKGVGVTVRAEGGGGSQTLLGPTGLELAAVPLWYGDLQVRVRVDAVQLFATARLTSFTVLTSDPALVAGRVPNQAFADAPMVTGFLGAELLLGALQPGLSVRVRQPALRRITFDFGGSAPPPNVDALANGFLTDGLELDGFRTKDGDVLPRVGAKLFVRWSPTPSVTLAAEAHLEVDGTRWVPAPTGVTSTTRAWLEARTFVQVRW